jgi:mediator of RNA polymerase II transcription subunit 16, fungi type
MTRLRRLESVVLSKIVIAVTSIQFGKAFCISFNDGTVEYRDRFTMNEIYSENSIDRVTSLRQIGFSLQDEMPCRSLISTLLAEYPPVSVQDKTNSRLCLAGLQMALSPTNCSTVQICDDGKVKWNKLHYPLGDIGNNNKDRTYWGHDQKSYDISNE